MSLLQRIAEIEGEIDRTQKNKATEKHLGQLKAKLAKLKSEVRTAGRVDAVGWCATAETDTLSAAGCGCATDMRVVQRRRVWQPVSVCGSSAQGRYRSRRQRRRAARAACALGWYQRHVRGIP
jgi:hypothetical protein